MIDYDAVRLDWWGLLHFHLKIHGTRPQLDTRTGEPWGDAEFAKECSVGDQLVPRNAGRAVQYWYQTDEEKNRVLPNNLKAIEAALMGKSPVYDSSGWRIDLRKAHSIAFKARRKRLVKKDETAPKIPSVISTQQPILQSNFIPRAPTHFARPELLDEIDRAFQINEPAAVVLHGLRGVGKTALALAYADRHAPQFRAMWWIRAAEDASIISDILDLGIRLSWIREIENEQLALTCVLGHLRQDGDGLLLVYDNASGPDAIRSYLPGGAARVLVTSNNHAWRKFAAPVEIKQWPKEIGGDFLIARSGCNDAPAAAAALSESLGGLALAHEMAAAFCEHREISLAQYKKRFDAEPVKYLNDDRFAPYEYGSTVGRTFSLAIDAATKNHPAAEPLIVYAAMLPRENIPLFLFSENHHEFEQPFSEMIEGGGLEEALSELRAFALIEREEQMDEHDASFLTETFHLHTLVREIARCRRDTRTQQEIFGRLFRAIINSFRFEILNHPRVWPIQRRLVPLAEPMVENESAILPSSRSALVKLSACLINYLYQVRGSYKKALALAELTLARSTKYFGDEDNYTLQIIDDLSVLYRLCGQPNEAETLARRGVDISIRFKGKRHFLTAGLMASLAIALGDNEKYDESWEIFEDAIDLYQEHYGPDGTETTMLESAAAIVAWRAERYAVARDLAVRVIVALTESLGADDVRTIAIRQRLEKTIIHPLQTEDLMPHYASQLAQQEAVLGEGHPDTIDTLMLIGELHRNTSKAREVYVRALGYAESAYGVKHSLVGELRRRITLLS
jgi:hypothetical protein